MKSTIAIIGGTGKVGKFLAETAIKKGYTVRMLVRNPEKVSVTSPNIELIKGYAQNPHSIRSLLEGCEAVVNTFGQPNRDTPLYSEVTKLIITIMGDIGIKRYIGVTGGSLDIYGDKKSFVNKLGAIVFRIMYSKMIKDKKKELIILQESKIDWTLVRLPFIYEKDINKTIKENLFDMPGLTITNRNIADFLIDEISNSKYIRKTPFIAN
ncbi:NAD(P)H-binding protein [Bacillus sp. TL12]|uniref:NAD(P)H-binding protein n=1 Tax=Bacillus sp. TL12 TaxID=2894756 RepID=UPI001F52A39A|nr:NAD(P)H-binding protein [Bacillus sp. TL12]MCI0768489.1 NAD(P)H-binding protein [Bacillus sp. TL12]